MFFVFAALFNCLASKASEEISLGRERLSRQTPADLQFALSHFNHALALEPSNLEANLLKAATLLVLEQSSIEFQQQLTQIGVTVSDSNIYNFVYQLPVDADGHIRPVAGVSSGSTLDYLNTRISPLLEEALACLANFGNNPTTKAFRIQLSAAETSLADVRVDYGDVLILRSLLKAAKAGLALANSYNLNAEYALIYRLFKAANLTPEQVLSELPSLLMFSGSDQRTVVKSAIIAANADYQAGYAFTKNQRQMAGNTPYLFEFSDPAEADDFASELAVMIGNLATGQESYLYRVWYPYFLKGLTINSSALFSSTAAPRSFVGAQFNQGYPTRSSWPDESFGDILPEEYSRKVLLDEFDYVMGQLIDSDGDGLSDSWERGYGRYEVVKGQFTTDSATFDAQSRGGHLATFTSQAEWDWFRNRHWREVDAPLYIGLFSDRQQPANWSWATAENGVFRNWASGQPVDDGVQTTTVIDADLTWRSLRLFQGYYWDPMTWISIVDMPPENIGYVLERGYPTDHKMADTDGDGFNDRVETNIETDPNNAAVFPTGPDLDGDGVNNYRESIDQTDPLDPSSYSALSVGLIAHYPFTGDAKDESGFDRDGNVFGATLAPDRFGLPNAAYDFDGMTSYIGTPAVVLQYGSAATFSAWVKVLPGGFYQRTIVAQPKDTYSTGLRLGVLNEQLEGAISNPSYYNYPGYYWSPNIYTILSPARIAGDGWRHVALVSEGWATRLYLDGNEVAASYDWTGGQASLERILIGKEFENPTMPGSTNHFAGQIDDVRVYDRALTAAEVTELFARESAPLTDTDGDGLPDVFETNTGVFVSRSNTGTNPNVADTDGDGLLDGVETNTGFFVGATDTGSNPNSADSNADGIFDGEAVAGAFDPSVDLGPAISWFTSLVQAEPGRFGLASVSSIMDLNVGPLMLQRVGQNAILKMQFQSSTNLATQPFTDFGSPITNSIPMPGRVGFVRVRVSGDAVSPPTPAPAPAPTPNY